MGLFKTSLDDIQKWAQAKNYSKIIAALTNSDPAIRIAAAKALGRMDSSPHYTAQAVLDSSVNALVAALKDDNPQVLVEVVLALGNFHHPGSISPIIDTVRKVKDAEIRKTMLEQGLRRIVDVNDKGAQSDRCLEIFAIIAQKTWYEPDLVDSLLFEIAHTYITGGAGWHSEESALGNAITNFGPRAGEQLLRQAEFVIKTITRSWEIQSAAKKAKEFGERIIGGSECGSNHQFGPGCVCVKCGKTIHDIGPTCTCRRCGAEGLHQWQGMYNTYFYKCVRCGKMRHMNETE